MLAGTAARVRPRVHEPCISASRRNWSKLLWAEQHRIWCVARAMASKAPSQKNLWRRSSTAPASCRTEIFLEGPSLRGPPQTLTKLVGLEDSTHPTPTQGFVYAHRNQSPLRGRIDHRGCAVSLAEEKR